MFDNIDPIFESAKIYFLEKAIILRESEKYRKFTEEFLCKVGDLILSNFHGISIEFKARIKSVDSTNKKIEKNAQDYLRKQVSSEEVIDLNDFNLFDIYGGKVVVFSVSDDFYSDFITIDGFLRKKKKCKDYLKVAKEDYNNSPDSADKKEILRLNHIIYREVDSMIQRYVSDAICDFVIHDPTLKKEFGLYTINSRMREYNNSNEYIAKHITLASENLKGWYMELQFKSLRDYEIARTGDAAHHKRNNKNIAIPTSIYEVNEDSIPSYMVYVPKGTLYIPTFFESLYHYLEPVCTPDTLKKLFRDMPDDQTGSFKKF